MERTFTILLGFSFALIALFGFGVTSACVNGAHVGCVTDTFQELQGSACPVTGNPFALLASHLAALQSFVGNTGFSILVSFLLAAMAAILFVVLFLMPPFLSSRAVTLPVACSGTFRKYRRWTALHETSPTDFL